jgi:hypothetical protein
MSTVVGTSVLLELEGWDPRSQTWMKHTYHEVSVPKRIDYMCDLHLMTESLLQLTVPRRPLILHTIASILSGEECSVSLIDAS